MKRAGLLILLVVVGVLAGAAPASAHPLGRFTVNQYAGLRVVPGAVEVDYVVDMAELPAFQTRPSIDIDRDGEVSTTESDRYAAKACGEASRSLRLTVDDRPAALAAGRTELTFPAGEGGLSTLRLSCSLRAEVTLPATIRFENGAYPDRVGWREITAVGDGVTLSDSDVPAGSVSDRLTAYPSDPLASAPDARTASFSARAGSGVAPLPVSPGSPGSMGAVDRLTAAFNGVVEQRELTVGVGLVGVLLAVVLGAAHAVAPGHGKTVMAAVLLGERGTWRQAAVIAGSVTVTHTAGVLVLGAALAGSLAFAPQRVYGVLGAVSGVLLAVVGVNLLRKALHNRRHGVEHHHHGSAGHHHGPGGHHHGPGGHHHGPGGHHHGSADHHSHAGPGHDHGPADHHAPVRKRTLLTLGFAGGLLPSPSAVVVLLGAVALGRPWYGILLVIAYGLGMAVTLIGIGLALSRWGSALGRRLPRRLSRWQPALPVVTSAVIVLVGITLTTQAVLAQA